MGLLNELGFTAPPSIGDAEKQMSSGGLPPEGVHHAVLEGVGGIPNAEGRGWKMNFKILAGPGKDMVVEDVVWKAKGDDAKKDARVNNRILIYAHRLGLLKKLIKDGKEVAVEVEGKHEFGDCLGAPCFIEVRHEDEEYEKNGKKHTIKKAKLTFEGVLSPDDKKVKDVPKAANLPPAASVGKPAGAAAKKDDFGDL